MAGRIPLGPNEPAISDLLYQVSVIANDGKPALAVVNPDGSTAGNTASVIGIGPLGLNNVSFDTVVYTNTSSTVDTYQYYADGTGGTLKATITITYTDTTKTQISTAVRT